MKLIYIIIIIIIIVFIINIIIINRDTLNYFITTYNTEKFNKEGLPLPPIIIKKIINFIKNIKNIKTYTFIDFGCGSGNMIEKVYPIVGTVDAIEYHEKQANATKDRFKDIDNIVIYPINMLDYKFKQTNTILYLYEPLWLLETESALEIYSKVFENLIINKQKIYVIYCSAIKYKHLDMNFFKKYNLKLIEFKSISKGIPFQYNNLYFLEI
jgi:hypothetical protein